MTKTAYLPADPGKIDEDETYLVLFYREGTRLPFIVESHDYVNNTANACEEYLIRDRNAGKKHKYFFTKASNVLERLPLPLEMRNERPG
jgi:hypothetical protein